MAMLERIDGRMSRRFGSFRLFGLRLHCLTEADLHGAIGYAVREASDTPVVFANHNLHSVYVIRREPRMRACFAMSEFVFIDGMPLVKLGRLFGAPVSREHRLAAIDIVPGLMRCCRDLDAKVFLLGSKPGVTDKVAPIFESFAPGVRIGHRHGYFDATSGSPESEAVIAEVNASGADVLFVGMGMPRQEIWIAENRHKLNVKAILPFGACMDYYAGEIPTPPRWLGKLYLEWLYRLLCEPRRLAFRYLIEPWFVLAALLKEDVFVRRPVGPRYSPPEP